MFRRKDTFERIIERLRVVQPNRIYLLGDAGRNADEQHEVQECRETVEKLIDWPCEVIKHYAECNRGVYENIGGSARWVFEREERAIFIEDDNLPEVTFFRYAEELLEKYQDVPEVGWICGTNYYPEMESRYSYQFTRHLLPCTWASWGHKFLHFYDGEFGLFAKKEYRRNFYRSYQDRFLWLYRWQLIRNEIYRKNHGKRFASWDYQMLWSIRAQGMYGIVPMKNQVTNIGVDNFSIHGGTTKAAEMTNRFCEVKSIPMEFPLKHPEKICIDVYYEKLIGEVISPPVITIIKSTLSSNIKLLLGKDVALSWKLILKGEQ